MADHFEGWTVQSANAPDKPEDVPGDVVLFDELPDKDVLVKAGVDIDQLFAGLTVAVDAEEKAAILGEAYPAADAEPPVPNPEPENPLKDEEPKADKAKDAPKE